MSSYQGDLLRKYATNLRAESLPGRGHWLPEECPEQLNALIVDFLTSK